MKTHLLSFVFLAAFLLLAFDCGLAGAESLCGTWLDPETNTEFIFIRMGSGPVLACIIDDDGERYILKSFFIKGENNVGWTYFVPSTNYRTSFDCIHRGYILDCTWENDHGMSGTEILSQTY